MEAAYYTRTTLTEDEARAVDDAYGELAAATRELADAQLRTQVDLDEARAVTAEVRALTERLLVEAREGALGTEIGPGRQVRNHGNAVTGLRNPFASTSMPVREVDEDRHVHRSFDLGALYEGPPGLVHGGVSALVLDQLLGESAAVGGGPGMTARLTVHYRRPTPLGTVEAEGWVERVDGRKTTARGVLRDPEGNTTVEAEGLFVLPRWAEEHPEWQQRHDRATFE
jgi:acyl-coenzyme A thioesterase PaaI-like protein